MKNIEVFSEINEQLLQQSISNVRIPNSDDALEVLFAYTVLLRATENAGALKRVQESVHLA